jgi:hypothetical protein
MKYYLVAYLLFILVSIVAGPWALVLALFTWSVPPAFSMFFVGSFALIAGTLVFQAYGESPNQMVDRIKAEKLGEDLTDDNDREVH